MGTDFDRLASYITEQQVEVTAETFSIYHKWDMVKKIASYTAGIPVSSVPSSLAQGIISGIIPPANVNTIRHIGSYVHLGNAWATQYMMQRGKEFKLNKSLDAFETYYNVPGEVPEHELVTDIHFPIK